MGTIGTSLLTHYLHTESCIQGAWVVLQQENLPNHRVIAELSCDVEGTKTTAEGERQLSLPATFTAFVEDVANAPQTSVLSSGNEFTIIPLLLGTKTVGSVLIQWTATADSAIVAPLAVAAPVLALVLHSQSRETIFRDLERSKQQWEAAFDSLQDLLFIYDIEGRLQKVNKALAKRLGYPPREIIACPTLFNAHFEDVLKLPPRSQQWNSKSLESIFEVQCADVHDHNQNLAGWVYILRDITDRVGLEQQMRQNEKLAALGEMVSGIAHELNNPLTSIVGYAEMLVQSTIPTPEAVRNRIRKIGMEADRAALIVQNMLAFVRPPASNQVPLCLNEIIYHVAELRADVLKSHSVELHLVLDQHPPLIKGCPHELQQVLLNLIDNSIHALSGFRKQGNITLCTEGSNEQTLSLSVTDDGHGILPEHKEKLLLPFFTTKRVGEGSGLGLSISYGILRSHGATLQIHSEVGQGAEFKMEFPVFSHALHVSPEPVTQPQANVTHKRQRPEVPILEGLHIAVLDDEILVLELITEMLSDSGHHVSAFNSPTRAFDALAQTDFDIILCDVRMPEMSGMEFYEEIRRRNPSLLSQIMFLTGDVLAPETRTFLETNQCAYLNKPFKAEILRNKITEIVIRERERQALKKAA